jgi:MFS family permease
MADIFGRTTALVAAILLMMLGSTLCTAAPVDAFPILILGRAIQGLSAAGINVTIKVILADKVSLKENAKNTSIFSMFGGLSYALGPVIGGFLTDKNWRWCFGINLPVAFVGVILVFFVLRPQLLGPQPLPQLPDQDTVNESTKRKARFKSRMSMIDFGGQFLFLAGIGLLILALTWGGAIYPWNSVHVITSLILGGLLTLCFIVWEYMMSPTRYLSKKFPLQHPTIPWELLSQRNIGLLFYINMATGMGMFTSHEQRLSFPYQHS